MKKLLAFFAAAGAGAGAGAAFFAPNSNLGPFAFSVHFFATTGFVAAGFFAPCGLAFFVPTLADPSPPILGGFGPSTPPMPAILPCSWLSVGPFVMGMNAGRNGAAAMDGAAARTRRRAARVRTAEDTIVLRWSRK